MPKMKYSEFLTLMIKNIKPEMPFYLCNEAKFIVNYDNRLSTEQKEQAKPHYKRFITHIKRLLKIQEKQLFAARGYKPKSQPTALTFYFDYSYENKLKWLIALRNKHAKAGN